MKIAYLVGLYPKVSHTFIRREIEGLEQAGFEVLRYSVRRNAEPLVDERDIEEQRRTQVVLDAGVLSLALAAVRACVTRPRRFSAAVGQALRLARANPRGPLVHLVYVAEASYLLFELRRQRVEHLHAHFATNPTTVALLCRLLGGPPFSFTVHSPDSSEIPGQVGLGSKASTAKFVATVSDRARAQLLPWVAPEDHGKLQVVRTLAGAEFTASDPISAEKGVVFVSVARLSPEKGPLVLIDAFEAVVRRGVDARLVLVGDGDLRPVVEDRVAELELGDRVVFTGNLDESGVRDAILAAHVLVIPSFYEGLPVVLLEAFSLQRPVITTAVGAVHELLEPGKSGWIVPSGSAEALADAMAEAACTPRDVLEQMGRAGAEAVEQLHSPEEQIGKLADLISA